MVIYARTNRTHSAIDFVIMQSAEYVSLHRKLFLFSALDCHSSVYVIVSLKPMQSIVINAQVWSSFWTWLVNVVCQVVDIMDLKYINNYLITILMFINNYKRL